MNDIRPDIVVTAGGKELIIEIYVTHSLKQEKMEKIKERNISALEINLSERETQIDGEDLKNVVLGNSPEKQWKYNVLEESMRARFIRESEKRVLVSRGRAKQIDTCPIPKRVWRGKYYASFIYDCVYCDFLIDSGIGLTYRDKYAGAIFCSGKARIACLEDFKLSSEERNRKYNSIQEIEEENDITAGRCPYCGGDLKQREGKYGEFYGCSQFPSCQYTLNFDPETGQMLKKTKYR